MGQVVSKSRFISFQKAYDEYLQEFFSTEFEF